MSANKGSSVILLARANELGIEIDARAIEVMIRVQSHLAHLLDEAVRIDARPRPWALWIEPCDRLAVDNVGKGVRRVVVAADRHDLGSPRDPGIYLGVDGDLPPPGSMTTVQSSIFTAPM